MKRLSLFMLLLALLLSACAGGLPAGNRNARVLRLGYLANVTHAQAVLGLADGTFERASGMAVEARLFNAGPAAITALYAGEVDLLYVGASPALNGYMRSQGKALKVLAGAASGGSVLVVRQGVDLAHLDHKRLGSPGLGNTQDISLRHQLDQWGYRTRELGGTVQIISLSPADLLALFKQGQVDGAWVPEPWGSRMILEAGGVLALDEKDLWPLHRFATTLLVVHRPFLEANRPAVKGIVQGHVQLTNWIQSYPEEAKAKLQTAFVSILGQPLSNQVLDSAWNRLEFVYDPMVESVLEQANRAHRLGLLGEKRPDFGLLFDLTLLEEVAP